MQACPWAATPVFLDDGEGCCAPGRLRNGRQNTIHGRHPRRVGTSASVMPRAHPFQALRRDIQYSDISGAARHEPLTQDPPTTSALPPLPGSAIEAYRGRLQTLEGEEKALQRRHIQLGYLRLLIGVALVVFLLPPRWWALVPFLAFALAARAHGHVLAKLAETRRAVAFYHHAIARTEERWGGLRPRSTRLDTSQSLFAADLDLFGPASLFELLCEARTSLGEDKLAAWLLHPAPVAEVLARQSAVADLRARLHLREITSRAPGPTTAMLDLSALTSWTVASRTDVPIVPRWLAPVLLVLFAIAAAAAPALHAFWPLLILAAISRVVTVRLRRSFQVLFAEVGGVSRSLRTAGALIAALERESFTTPYLQALQSSFTQTAPHASNAIARLAVLATWIEARSNYLVRILDLFLPYSVYLAGLVQRWHHRNGLRLGAWLDAMAEYEALLSLSAYSFEHPEDPFPQITEAAPIFEAHGIAHPLLGRAQAVRNDVMLDGTRRLLLISGSNMSGKSTLLRSVGVNAVLAFAGAPVRARMLQLSSLTVAASIQVGDSLQAGRSRFYAEILRLRAITEAAHQHANVLFLLDEVLAGTNSSDRLLGARGLVEDLLRSGAVGLLSTHDLALTEIATTHNGVRNAHFEDQVTADQLLFDYTLRDGIVQKSNGLALMRLVGLKV